jgi:hypothetical protein
MSPQPHSQPLCFSQFMLDASSSFGMLAFTPLSLSAFMSILISAGYWRLLWEVGLLPHPCSQPLLLFFYLFTENSALRVYLLASPPFPRADSAFHLPHPQSLFDYSSLFVVQFCWGGSVCPGAVLVYVTGGGQGSPAQCVVLTCSFCQLTSRQVGSRQQWRGEMLSTFLSAAWRKEAFHRLGVQDVRV